MSRTSPGRRGSAADAVSALGRREHLVVLDADDTLWHVEPLYDDARAQARGIAEAAGLDGAEWESLERRLDVANVATFGLSPKRFPTSCVQAYREMAGAPDSLVESRIWSAAFAVFARPAPLAPDAGTAMKKFRSVARVALLTKGDENVQRTRLASSGLANCFDGVWIVEEKNRRAFQKVLTHFSCRPDRAWSVGNSLRSDIVPALEIGMNAIWIDAHVWEYERAESEIHAAAGYPRAHSLIEAANMISAHILRGAPQTAADSGSP